MLLSRSPDAEWVGLVASAALVVLLYAVQALILSRVRDERRARSVYALVVAATVPVCWGVSPGWNHPQWFPIATLLGWPVTVHAVPLWSFHRGLALRRSGRPGRWWAEAPLHLLVGVPLWYFAWGLTQLFVLGFIWI
jgi:hypothetical protein